MASKFLYFKFKSAKDFSSIPIDGNYISVAELKDRIFESKIGRGRDFDLVITNAQTNEDYVDESTLILANTSVLIRRIPGWPRKPIVLAPVPVENETNSEEERDSAEDSVKSAAFIYDTEEWDEFFSSNSLSSSSTLTTIDDEDSKIKALVDTPALEWQQYTGGGGTGRRMMGRNIPPEGYVCHRCKVAGHYIQHCPTNGDPDYDIKKVKAPRGIPKSMLLATPDGLYGLPDGKVAVLRSDEAAFEKEVEGLPSAQRSVCDIPPELYCKLCKKVMEYAVITSKCCFDSFCDKCIRSYIISNSICVCGATNILADHLLPNLTLRNTINRMLESNDSSVKNNDGSAVQIQHMVLQNPRVQVSSPGQSVASIKEAKAPSIQFVASNKEAEVPSLIHTVASNKEAKVPSLLQSVALNKEAKVQSPVQSVASNKEEAAVASKMASKKDDVVAYDGSEAAKEKRKKAHMPSDDGEMQWSAAQNLAAQNYMMSMAFAAYNPYWTAGIQPEMRGFMTPGPYAGAVPYVSSGFGPLDSFGSVLPQVQCSGPPIMSRSREFEAKKAVTKRKREADRQESLKDQEHDGEVCSGDISSVKSKINRYRSERPSTDRRELHYNNYKRHHSYHDEHHSYQGYTHCQRSRHLHSHGTISGQ